MNLVYESLAAADAEACLPLAMQLWPDEDTEGVRKEMVRATSSPDDVLIGCKDGKTLVGFAQAGLRHDYVEGTSSSPVAYLEGIFVLPDYRKQGVARRLVEEVCTWGRDKGCTELGSDAHLDNTMSHEFHKAVGFTEAERLATFVKKIT